MQGNRKRQIERKRKKEIKVLIVNVFKIIHVNLNYVADHINCTKNSRLYKYLVLAFIKTKKERKKKELL